MAMLPRPRLPASTLRRPLSLLLIVILLANSLPSSSALARTAAAAPAVQANGEQLAMPRLAHDPLAAVPLALQSSPSRIRDMTFEGNSATGASGADSTSGTITIETSAPLKDAHSVRVAAGSSYLQENFTATDNLYVSLYLKVVALPSAEARILQIIESGSSTTIGNLVLRSDGTNAFVRLRNGNTTIADSPALHVGQLYRLGIQQKNNASGPAVLRAYLVEGDTAFGAPFAESLTVPGPPSPTGCGSGQPPRPQQTSSSTTSDSIRRRCRNPRPARRPQLLP